MRPDVQHAVAVLLAEELFGATGSPPQVSLSGENPMLDDYTRRIRPRRDSYPYGEGTLLALETLALLTHAEAGEWRQRFELATQGWSPGPRAEGEQAALAGGHLEWLVGLLAKAEDTGTRSRLLDRLNGAISLYLQTGLVRPEDAPTWGSRVEEALGKTVEEFELVDQAGLDPDELDALEQEAVGPRGALVRVVPADPARHDGLCFTAAALYEEGFELHWHALRQGQFDAHESLDFGRFQAADDLGTEYQPLESGGASWSERDGPYAVLGESRCGTAVPWEASELRVRKGAAEWLIRLS